MSNDTRAARFRALHQRGKPLVLFNVWDAGSTRAVADAGAAAIATSSWAVAASQGHEDGEKMSRGAAIEAIRRIAAATDLPVTADLESGYGPDADAVAETIAMSIEAGAIGCNLEDSDPRDGRLRDVDAMAARIRAARGAADRGCPGYFINARCDVFFQHPAARHDASLVDEAVSRARAYEAAGADGLFVPGLVDAALIERLASTCRLPVNVMRTDATRAIADIARLGVARISHGPWPYRLAMQALAESVPQR